MQKTLLFVLFIGFIGCQDNKKTKQNHTPIQIDTGEVLYRKNCKACHGKDGRLQLSKASDLSVSKLLEAEISNIIINGRGNMVGFGDRLKPEEVNKISVYVLSLKNTN